MSGFPVDQWVREKTGGDLAAWQLKKLNETLSAAQKSRWYGGRVPGRVDTLEELQTIPTMCADHLREQGTGLLCVPQTEVCRVVSIPTSGSSGAPKRVYFTEEDQELTVDYFQHGLSVLVRPGDSMLVCYPCVAEGGLGRLICRGLERIPARAVPWGVISSLEEAGMVLEREQIETLVGFPVQILALAKYCAGRQLRCNVRAVLLSADGAVPALKEELRRLWGCEVYEHYGMTEMGLGCAVDCHAHMGLHIRENDLLLEVVDEGGRPLPDGVEGELVFTTLTRRAMPFIRYRTGDRAAILPGACPCGCALKRMTPPRRAGGGRLRLSDWDEKLLPLPGLSDFALAAAGDTVRLTVETQLGYPRLNADLVEELARSLLPPGMKLSITIRQEADRLALHPGCKRVVREASL